MNLLFKFYLVIDCAGSLLLHAGFLLVVASVVAPVPGARASTEASAAEHGLSVQARWLWLPGSRAQAQ